MIVDRWAELEAGTLQPPAVVQAHESTGSKVLAWIFRTDRRVIGPFVLNGWSQEAEAALLARAGTPRDEGGYSFELEDGSVVE